MFSTLFALLTPPAFVGVRSFPLSLEEWGNQCMAAEGLLEATGCGFCGGPESCPYLGIRFGLGGAGGSSPFLCSILGYVLSIAFCFLSCSPFRMDVLIRTIALRLSLFRFSSLLPFLQKFPPLHCYAPTGPLGCFPARGPPRPVRWPRLPCPGLGLMNQSVRVRKDCKFLIGSFALGPACRVGDGFCVEGFLPIANVEAYFIPFWPRRFFPHCPCFFLVGFLFACS